MLTQNDPPGERPEKERFAAPTSRRYLAYKARKRRLERSAVIWTPAQLFAQGQQGVWYEPKPEYLYQDSAGTTPVTADGQPVGYMEDLSGNGNHATQATAAAKPIYRTDGTLHWLEYDGIDDLIGSVFSLQLPYTRVSAFQVVATADGDRYFGGGSGNTSILYNPTSVGMTIYNGLNGPSEVANPELGVNRVWSEVVQGSGGASLYKGGALIGSKNAGTLTVSGITIGAAHDNSGHSNINFIGLVFVANDGAARVDLESYIATNAGVNL